MIVHLLCSEETELLHKLVHDTKQKQIRALYPQISCFPGLGIRSLIFCVNRSFFESKRAIHSVKGANCSCRSFGKERWERFPLLQRSRRVMQSDSLCCFWPKKGKSRLKRTNWKFSCQCPLLKRVNCAFAPYSFCKERIAPVAL